MGDLQPCARRAVFSELVIGQWSAAQVWIAGISAPKMPLSYDRNNVSCQ